MDLLQRFFKSTKAKDPVDAAIEAIADLEIMRSKRSAELQVVKEDLQTAFEEGILAGANAKNQGALSAKIIEIQSEVDAFRALIARAKTEAMKTIRCQKPERRKRIAKLKKEEAIIRAEIDSDRIAEIVRFIRKHGGTIDWPGQQAGGRLGVAVTVLSQEDIAEIAAKVETEPIESDARKGKLAALQREIRNLELLDYAPNEITIDGFVDELRRAA